METVTPGKLLADTASTTHRDQFGYPLAYFTATGYLEPDASLGGLHVYAKYTSDGRQYIATRDITGDVYCATCALALASDIQHHNQQRALQTRYDQLDPTVFVIALGINGELDGTETCHRCGEGII